MIVALRRTTSVESVLFSYSEDSLLLVVSLSVALVIEATEYIESRSSVSRYLIVGRGVLLEPLVEDLTFRGSFNL